MNELDEVELSEMQNAYPVLDATTREKARDAQSIYYEQFCNFSGKSRHRNDNSLTRNLMPPPIVNLGFSFF
jgi:hypothetical protein